MPAPLAPSLVAGIRTKNEEEHEEEDEEEGDGRVGSNAD
jgi:hypothetical protein